MKNITSLMSALSDPTRLRALQLLGDGEEHCVCELMKKIGATQSRMSRHMACLKKVGLVLDRRQAPWVHYRRRPKLPPATLAILDAVLDSLPTTPQKDKSR